VSCLLVRLNNVSKSKLNVSDTARYHQDNINLFMVTLTYLVVYILLLANRSHLLNHTEYYINTAKLIHNTCILYCYQRVTETVCDINHKKYRLKPSTQIRQTGSFSPSLLWFRSKFKRLRHFFRFINNHLPLTSLKEVKRTKLSFVRAPLRWPEKTK